MPSTDGAATLWLAADGVWLGRSSRTAQRVLASSDSKLEGDAEWLEPLAVALDGLAEAQQAEKPLVEVRGPDDGPRGEALRIVADADVDSKTLRRVVTVARGVGYGPFEFAVSPETSLNLSSDAPVGSNADERPIRVKLDGAGALKLEGKSMKAAGFTTKLTQMLEFRERRCVSLDAEDDVNYATWLATAARLAELDIDCLNVVSPLLPTDEPPPPPPEEEDELPEEEGVHPKAEEVAPSAPSANAAKGPEGRSELLRWWKRATEAKEARDVAGCKKRLAEAHERLGSATTPEALRFQVAARLEDHCGSADKARALRVQRTEAFPQDWQAWQALGISDFAPLMPDPGSAKPFNGDIPAAKRRALATTALASFEKAAELAPRERDPLTWSVMALTQRRLARETAEDGASASTAKLDAMDAWRYQKKLCDLDKRAACPEAPMTEDEYTALKAKLGG
ncbi:MAG: hypothetical protein AAGA54_17465 [Myxococcota bacterium]